MILQHVVSSALSTFL